MLSRLAEVVEGAVEYAVPADDELWFLGQIRQAPDCWKHFDSYSAVYGGIREGCVVGVEALTVGDEVLNVRVLVVSHEL